MTFAKPMKIAVFGAGAVGCYYGGMLARAGHEVVLVGRPLHVDAVRRDGLLLETADFAPRLSLAASTEAAAIEGAQLVLCCVKSTDRERAAADLARYLAPDALLLSLQNGVDNAPRLQALLGHRQRDALNRRPGVAGNAHASALGDRQAFADHVAQQLLDAFARNQSSVG